MKKLLLSFALITGFTFVANSQCLTCNQGKHAPGDPTAITIPYSQAQYTPHTPNTPNGNHTLAQSYIQLNVCGLSYKTTSVEINTRATWQPGSGFPAPMPAVSACFGNNTNIFKAFVYWDASYTEASPPATSVTLTNPQLVTGTYPGVLIGQDGPKCWGETGTAVWRADVTPCVSGLGGIFNINSINGFANAAWEVDGATLIIIYNNTAANYSGSIVIWDGCWTFVGGGTQITMNGFNVCANSAACGFEMYGDVQNNVNAGIHSDIINGTPGPNLPNNMWNYDSNGTNFAAGQSTCFVQPYVQNYPSGNDCWLWAVSGLYWQNTTCQVCVPASLTMNATVVEPTCGNSNGKITIGVVGGTPPYTYTWSPNVSTSAVATGLSVGVYVITVVDSTGCNKAEDTVKLINPTAPNLTVTTVNIKCHGQGGGSATVNATGGTPPYTYLWTPGNQTTQTITGLTAGSYTILVTDAAGCQSVDIAYVTQPPPFAVLVDSTHGLKCANSGPIGAIWVSGSGGTPGYTYAWTPGGQTTSFITGLSQGTYSVQVTDANGCVADTSLFITTVSPMTMSVFAFNASCGQPNGFAFVSSLNGGTPPYTYLWTNGYPFSFNFGLSAGLYCCTVTDANGCTDSACCTVNNTIPFTISMSSTPLSCSNSTNATATATVTGPGSPFTYLWTPSNQTNPTATALSAATYTVTVTDNSGCSGSAVITITAPPPVLLTVTPQSDTICIGQNLMLTATASNGTPPYNYQWTAGPNTANYTVNPIVTTVYTVIATDFNGCPATATDTVKVHPPLAVTINPGNVSACASAPTTFTATATGGNGVYSYIWTPGNMTSSSVSVNPNVTTSYTVVVTDNCGTPSATDSVKVTIFPMPVAGFKPDSIAGCSPMCVTFTDTSTIGGGASITKWIWNFGDGGPNDTIHNPTSHCYPTPGQYSVILKVISNQGCTAYDTAKNLLTVYSHPTAKFILSPQPTTILAPTIFFTDQSTDAYGITNWSWTFGDMLDSVSTHQNAVHTYQDTGHYCATLRVTNLHGCMDSTMNCLVIDPQFTLYIPSGFTPGNKNGLNLTFLPKGEALQQFDMYIFDRWGSMLFHSNNLQIGWDGTVNHMLVQEDTYVYLINVVDNYNKQHSYIGSINLVK